MYAALDMPPLAPARVAAQDTARAAAVCEILKGYAERGAFRGFAAGPLERRKQTFEIFWHYGRQYPLVLDLKARTLTFRHLLPEVPRASPMVAALKDFVAAFASPEVPAHRRLDPGAGTLKVRALQGRLTLQMQILGDQYEACARRIVHVTHEIFLVFLREGPYFDYRCQSLGLDPDSWG
jgi:hypothetical protein